MAKAMEDGMYAKATKPIGELFWLALTGGAYIALGFIFFVTTQQGVGPTSGLPIGVTKLIGGLVFSTGLMLVVMPVRTCSPAPPCPSCRRCRSASAGG